MPLSSAFAAELTWPDYEAAIGKSIKGMKIGIPKEYRVDGMSQEIDALWLKGAEWLKQAGDAAFKTLSETFLKTDKVA